MLHGPNGAGKTNLLEALHLGTQGFSPRARRDALMIRFDAEAARVRLQGGVGDNAFTTDLVLTRHDSRRVELNGERLELERPAQARADDARLHAGPARGREGRACDAPRVRRSRRREASAGARQRSRRVRGRTRPAKRGAPRGSVGLSSLEAVAPWTEAVATLGEALVRARMEALELVAPAFVQTAGELGLADATLAYDGEPASVEELSARMSLDVERGVTGAGPHLHDVRIEAGGRDLRVFGSQGEQRMAVLALVLAEAAALRARHDVSPLVLLDDVLSELDGDRRRALARMIERGSQTVITATATAALPAEPAQTLSVAPGEVR